MITQGRIVTDSMIIAGARRFASLAPALKDPSLPLSPPKQSYVTAECCSAPERYRCE